MKAMIPMNDYGIMADKNNTARVDSRFIAQFFEKRHSHVCLLYTSDAADE